jgi:prepilin-type N-terminal cleavage/methylation domain-containing protein/prepilin-type processing-associated H-X9-DG protein
MQTRHIKPAFTLVELLVVIAIIAVLISMLLPALAKARQAMYTVRCASNLRQIGMAFQLYRNDWNNWMPPTSASVNRCRLSGVSAGDWPWAFSKTYRMWNALGPYVNRPEWYGGGFGGTRPYPDFTYVMPKDSIRGTIWECFDDKDQTVDGSTLGYTFPNQNGYSESRYLTGADIVSMFGAKYDRWGLPRLYSQVPDPATAIHVSDAYYPKNEAKDLGDVSSIAGTTIASPAAALALNVYFDMFRHNFNKGCVILFADGHAAYYDRKEVQKNMTYYPSNNTSPDNFHLR